MREGMLAYSCCTTIANSNSRVRVRRSASGPSWSRNGSAVHSESQWNSAIDGRHDCSVGIFWRANWIATLLAIESFA